MSDDNDDYPTKEENEADKKMLLGDNVVEFPKAQKADDQPDRALALSKDYAIVTKNAKIKVIDETRLDDVIFLDKKDFMDKLSYRKVTTEVKDTEGNTRGKIEPETKLWLDNPKARRYDRVIFDPRRGHNPLGGGDYNLWRGFATQPKRGCCIKTLKYIKSVLCNNDKKIYRWLMAWSAHIFQRPWEKPETAVCLHGEEEGTGKSFFPMILSKLIDGDTPRAHRLYFKASNPKMLTGDFSGHLEHCLLLHAEEAFRAESEREDAIIKDLISGEDQGINPKGVEAKLKRSYLRLILTGNPPHIVKAGRFARRFLVLNVSAEHLRDYPYFKAILNELEHGGYEALMYYLTNYPINKFNLREVYKTKALTEQQIISIPEARFWYIILHEKELSFHGTSDKKYYGISEEYHIYKYKLFSQFQKFMNKRVEKNRSDEVSFGMRFAQFFPLLDSGGNVLKERNGKNMKFLKTDKIQDTNCYIIPSLKMCRAMFEAYLGQKIDWPDDGEWEEKGFGE